MCRKKDCSPADSAAISEEVEVLESLLTKVVIHCVTTEGAKML